MEDKNSQPEVVIPELDGMASADFCPVLFISGNSLDVGETDPKKVVLEPSKTQGFDHCRVGEFELEIRDIKSDPELVGFWLQGRSVRTIESYRAELKRFFTFTGVRLRDLTVSVLFTYADSLKENLSPSSQALSLAAVKSILGFGFKVGYLEKNLGAFIKLPKLPDQRVRRVIDESKIHEMIFSEPNPRNRLILRLLYSAGLRVSELCSLKWRDLQERSEAGQLVVRGKGDKQRIVLLSQGTWDELKSYRNEAEDLDPVFASQKGRGHLSRMQVLHLVKEAAARVGISTKVSPHWMRHSHATHALERGASIILVKETLGHGSIITTQKYLHSRPEESSSQFLGI